MRKGRVPRAGGVARRGIPYVSAYEYLHGVIISSPEESRISGGEFSACYFAASPRYIHHCSFPRRLHDGNDDDIGFDQAFRRLLVPLPPLRRYCGIAFRDFRPVFRLLRATLPRGFNLQGFTAAVRFLPLACLESPTFPGGSLSLTVKESWVLSR